MSKPFKRSRKEICDMTSNFHPPNYLLLLRVMYYIHDSSYLCIPLGNMAIQVTEFHILGYKIRKIFA